MTDSAKKAKIVFQAIEETPSGGDIIMAIERLAEAKGVTITCEEIKEYLGIVDCQGGDE